jgi:23S rRNA (uracil1939-C5)-methyltransferase
VRGRYTPPPTKTMPTSDPTPTRKPRRGDLLDASITSVDRKGSSLGRSGPYQVRMRGGVPGDRWRIDVGKRRGNRIEARPVELLEAGPARVPARCAHARFCGGCSFQECDYEEQLRQKQRFVREALAAHSVLGDVDVEPVKGCVVPWAYRNKMEFTFGNRRWIEPDEPQGAPADFALGLHVPRCFNKVLDLSECRIVFAKGERIMRDVHDLARELELSPWDVREHTGFLRHLVLREGVHTGEVMVDVVTSSESPELFDPFAEALLARNDSITTLVQTINTGVASVARGEAERVVHGSGWITESLLGRSFRISPRSFFQVNTEQAERLFEVVLEEVALTGEEVVYDLYSGGGSIALLLAPRAVEVLAFEQVPEAVADARRNARVNEIEGIRFFEGDVLPALDEVLTEGSSFPRPDLVVVDPPRAGLHPKVPPRILALGARRIVYVSCNATTAAVDLAALAEGGYRIERVRPVDLFPHTPHVECVVTLTGGG